MSDFSGSLRWLTVGARGEWWFSPDSGDATAVRWRYAFEPRSWLTWPMLALVNQLWAGYMRRAIAQAKRIVEAGGAP